MSFCSSALRGLGGCLPYSILGLLPCSHEVHRYSFGNFGVASELLDPGHALLQGICCVLARRAPDRVSCSPNIVRLSCSDVLVLQFDFGTLDRPRRMFLGGVFFSSFVVHCEPIIS